MPASKPGLDAGTHDLPKTVTNRPRWTPVAISCSEMCARIVDSVIRSSCRRAAGRAGGVGADASSRGRWLRGSSNRRPESTTRRSGRFGPVAWAGMRPPCGPSGPDGGIWGWKPAWCGDCEHLMGSADRSSGVHGLHLVFTAPTRVFKPPTPVRPIVEPGRPGPTPATRNPIISGSTPPRDPHSCVLPWSGWCVSRVEACSIPKAPLTHAAPTSTIRSGAANPFPCEATAPRTPAPPHRRPRHRHAAASRAVSLRMGQRDRRVTRGTRGVIGVACWIWRPARLPRRGRRSRQPNGRVRLVRLLVDAPVRQAPRSVGRAHRVDKARSAAVVPPPRGPARPKTADRARSRPP